MRWQRVVAVALVGVVVASSLGLATGGPTPPGRRASELSLFDSHISHIVFLMQENHAYDSLYGVYCTAVSKYCRTVPNGVPNACIPLYPANPSKGCVRPYNLTQVAPKDMLHVWNSTHLAWNNGSMNNFYVAEGTNVTFGHYNGTTVPFYWDLAEEYGLGDDFFSSDASYSLPNHWDEFASTPPASSQQNLIGLVNAPNHLYLNQSNRTASLESTLLNSSVSWRDYDVALSSYTSAIGGGTSPTGDAYDLWNPLAARAQSYQAGVSSHFVKQSAFFSDAQNGTLPNLSWVVPQAAESDHPPFSVTTGQQFVASVVDALEASPDWNSTVLFISWDEYGGFYDHVAPPVLDSVGDGFRVPLLAVGPWVRQGYVDHVQMDFGSVLHLMEERFGLKCLGSRDCNAKLPLGMFNFGRTTPRAPIGFATNATWVYPMPLQSSGKLPYYAPALGVSPYVPPAVPADVEVTDWS